MKKTSFTLFAILTLLIGCKETTTEPVITDTAGVEINTLTTGFYPTDKATSLSATVTHTDNSSGDATLTVKWTSSNSSIITNSENSIVGGYINGGEANITITTYNNTFSDSVTITSIKLTDFEITNVDLNTTGEHELEATGTFEDNASRVIYNNITWDANNSATFDTSEDLVTTITLYAGVTEVNATLFAYDNDTNITKSVIYTIE